MTKIETLATVQEVTHECPNCRKQFEQRTVAGSCPHCKAYVPPTEAELDEYFSQCELRSNTQ